MNILSFIETNAEKLLPLLTGPIGEAVSILLPALAPKSTTPVTSFLTTAESMVSEVLSIIGVFKPVVAGVASASNPASLLSEIEAGLHEFYTLAPKALPIPEADIDLVLQLIEAAYVAITNPKVSATTSTTTSATTVTSVPVAAASVTVATNPVVTTSSAPVNRVTIPTIAMPSVGSVPLQTVSDGPGPALEQTTSMADEGNGAGF